MVGQAPYLRATLPKGTQVQVWPDIISQSSPHLFPTSLPVITSCPIQIKLIQLNYLFILFKVALICVKILYRANRGRINRIDYRVNADSPKKNCLKLQITEPLLSCITRSEEHTSELQSHL